MTAATDSADASRLAGVADRTLVALAAAGILAWVVLEFALRRGVGPSVAEFIGSAVGAEGAIFALGFPAVAALIAWLGTRSGLRRTDWDYDLGLRPLAAGLGGVVAYWAVYLAAVLALATILDVDLAALGSASGGAAAIPTWAIALYLVGNGVVVPIAEELAWRGVIQTALTESYGHYVAIVVTALAFVGKHLVVDLAANPFRVVSLLVLAVTLCGLRARWGTASSTVAHIGMNLLATASLILA